VSAPAWWSAADQAELDVLILELVDGVADHRERCRVCSAGGPWCAGLREAFDVVLEWRRRRRLYSLATWLRARQDLADTKAAA
jgi:hypothetical protein